jgi:hypothetical protein
MFYLGKKNETRMLTQNYITCIRDEEKPIAKKLMEPDDKVILFL